MKKNWIMHVLPMLCISVIMLSACSGPATDGAEATSTPSAGKLYREEQYASLPDELNLYEEDVLNVGELQTNAFGEPALYQYVTDTDDNGDTYKAICEYTLNSDGNWQTKEYVSKALTEMFTDFVENERTVEVPFITRGDDGNLYALMEVCTWPDNENLDMFEEEKMNVQYYVLMIDENENTIENTELQTKTDTEDEETDYASEHDVTQFHVMENGSCFLVFDGSGAMWFDSATGTRTNFCESISDGAFGKKVGFGESEIVYYSTSKKKFGVLDADTLNLSYEFGESISEEYRKYEWYFDTDTTNWQMYAFNLSGLYRFSDFGKKTSATCLSADGSFDSLADVDIYDVLVGANQELYLLVRSETVTDTGLVVWDFGVMKYAAQ